MVKISAKSDRIWGSKDPKTTQKPPKKGYVIDAESIHKALKITNAILVKLTTVVYLHKAFNLVKIWGVTH